LLIAAVIPARNEDNFLEQTLFHLLKQTVEVDKIIVVNDGSEDRTRQVALSFNKVVVIDTKRNNQEYAVHTPILAHIINQGLEKISNDNLEYVLILGSDHLLPSNYLSKIIEVMEKDNEIVICSGQIKGERSVIPRGSGRVVRYHFWKEIGLQYPENYGFETYLLIKAQIMGFKVIVLDELVTVTQRATGKNYGNNTYVAKGKAIKALGYTPIYSVGKIILVILKNPKLGLYMLRGYISRDTEPYEQELRKYLKTMQHKRIKSYVIKPLKAINSIRKTQMTKSS
jgi:poly-beta-1,6-N-acetyl-D-glucosamine synthase